MRSPARRCRRARLQARAGCRECPRGRRSDRDSMRSRATGNGLLQTLDLRQDLRGFRLKPGALRGVVLFRILAGAVLEVQVAQVLVEHSLLFFEEIEARLDALHGDMTIRIEDICEEGDGEDGAG